MDAAGLAQLAQSLNDNEAFQLALTNMRQNALEGLALIPPAHTEEIRRLQSYVWAVDELRNNLVAYIRSGKPKRQAGIV